MPGEILVVYAFLETLEHHARAMADALDTASHPTQVEPAGSAELTEAYACFIHRWDAHRAGLQAGIVSVADALAAVRSAFAETDDQLAGALAAR